MTAFVEVIREGSSDMVWASDILHVPDTELEMAKATYVNTGKCSCSTTRRFVVDEPGYLYDLRSCAVCGRSLGTV